MGAEPVGGPSILASSVPDTLLFRQVVRAAYFQPEDQAPDIRRSETRTSSRSRLCLRGLGGAGFWARFATSLALAALDSFRLAVVFLATVPDLRNAAQRFFCAAATPRLGQDRSVITISRA
jgi:hypothetical protein